MISFQRTRHHCSYPYRGKNMANTLVANLATSLLKQYLEEYVEMVLFCSYDSLCACSSCCSYVGFHGIFGGIVGWRSQAGKPANKAKRSRQVTFKTVPSPECFDSP